MTRSFKIGELAKRVGVSVQTVRYYENEGLIRASYRTSGGYRYFDGDAVKIIESILYYKSLGFTLKEIRILLTYEQKPETYCEQAKQIFGKKIESVQEDIDKLASKKNFLKKKLKSCEVCEEKSDCRVLKKKKNPADCSKKS